MDGSDFVKRWFMPAAVLMLPVAALVFVQWSSLRPVTDFVGQLQATCFINVTATGTAAKKDKDLKDCPPEKPAVRGEKKPEQKPADQKQGQPKAAPAGDPPKPDPASQKQVAPAGQPPQDTAGSTPAPSPAPGATPPAPGQTKAPSTAEVRASEAKLRLDFGMASAVLQLIAIGGLLFAVSQLFLIWRNETEFANQAFIVGVSLAALYGALWFACNDLDDETFPGALLRELLNAAQQGGYLATDAAATFKSIVSWNLFTTYTAASLLLVFLAALTINSPAAGDSKARLVGLQFVIAIGAAIFTLGGLANKAGLEWGIFAIDGKELSAAATSLLVLWSLAGSAFLVTAVGVGYFGIRNANTAEVKPVGQGAPSAGQNDSAWALRTPNGEDFKAFGWVVQLLIALLPIGGAALTKAMDLLKGFP